MTARHLILAAGALGMLAVSALAYGAYGLAYGYGYAAGVDYQLEQAVARAKARQNAAEVAALDREARNQRLLNFMIAEGRCPPLNAYCPAIRMTAR